MATKTQHFRILKMLLEQGHDVHELLTDLSEICRETAAEYSAKASWKNYQYWDSLQVCCHIAGDLAADITARHTGCGGVTSAQH
jgi:hypothetical protein